ncbi:MAG TPA: M48 family metalloprotease [Blastocatellia bacterium]|nr:M48 family metalloprotease [Blastocatellia bacterium]
MIDDDEVTGYLNKIGARIVKQLPPSSLRFQFLLIDLPETNAFSLAGGRVYVSRKLVAFAQSEDELAGVIAHEIGHIIARQGSIDMTRWFREVLGVTQVGDRRDIFEKYNQIVDNQARKPKAFERGDSHGEKEQVVADQIGLFAMASAGYNPQASARMWDRIAETKGKTGGFFSDLFGTTKPEAKRLREMLRGLAALPPSCVETRVVTPAEDYQRWQAAVINYTGLGRKEVLHAVLSKTVLNPPLRGEITHLRFSPDGKYVLAQDDSGINVLSREPFAPLFRIEAPEAQPAQFTPDSQDILVSNAALRVEVWSIADQKLKSAREMTVRTGCLQSLLSPDGKTMACLDSDLALVLFDVASGAQVFQKKSFYVPDIFEIFLLRLFAALESGEASDLAFDWLNMGFSPDGRYFATGGRSTYFNAIGDLSTGTTAMAIDLTTRQPVNLRGPLKKLIAGGFAFLGPDRLIGVDRMDPKKSAIVSFPGGDVLDQVPLGHVKLTAAGHGNYVLIRPIAQYPVGVMDLKTKLISKANKQSALDVYDQFFASERTNGELGLYSIEKTDPIATVLLPRNPLGRLRVIALSPDLKWLAVSERTRGAVWNLNRGERVFHVRGFRGGYFGEDGRLHADFPKFEATERTMVQMDLASRQAMAGPEIKEDRASQHGPFVLVTKPAKKEGGFYENVIIEVHDARSLNLIWSKPFPKEAPRVWLGSHDATMVLSWPVSAGFAKNEIKRDPALSRRLVEMREKEGDYFLQVLDPRSGELLGRLLIETGKGSFRIESVFAVGDSVVISDSENRVLIYSLATGEQKGKVFGARAALSNASGLLCVENEPGQLALYDVASMEKRDEFVFSSPVSLARFSKDGKSLFVLTANQTAYVLDVASRARRVSSQ